MKEEIFRVKQQLIDLCQLYVWEHLAPVFNNHHCLLYFHFARYGTGKQEQYLSINGLRWEDVNYFIYATNFEITRRDPNSAITESISKCIKTWPDFKSLKLTAEELSGELLTLTTDGIFAMLGDGLFRLIVTKEGQVSYQPLTSDEIDFYPRRQDVL